MHSTEYKAILQELGLPSLEKAIGRTIRVSRTPIKTEDYEANGEVRINIAYFQITGLSYYHHKCSSSEPQDEEELMCITFSVHPTVVHWREFGKSDVICEIRLDDPADPELDGEWSFHTVKDVAENARPIFGQCGGVTFL